MNTPAALPLSAFDAWPSLQALRRASLVQFATLEQRLARAMSDLPGLVCVAAAGSLARLEAGPQADLDAIVVTDGVAEHGAAERVYAALDGLPLRAPKSWGIYHAPVELRELLAPGARGALDEAPAVFGKRFQFLLDTRPLYGHAAHASLRRRVLDWYTVGEDPAQGQLTALVRDLQRYQHAYATWQAHKFERDEEDGWYLRQAKLGSTRLVGFAGLLLLLGASSSRADKLDWLAAHLDLTPFERVATVMRASDAAAFVALAAHYEAVHRHLLSAGVRDELVAQSPRCAAELPRTWPPVYATLAEHNRELRRLLTRFVLDRRDDWAPDFHAQLLF